MPTNPTKSYWEQLVNNVIMLKQYVISIPLIHEALGTPESILLQSILQVL